MSKIESYTEDGKTYYCSVEYSAESTHITEHCRIQCDCDRLHMNISANKTENGSIVSAYFTYSPFSHGHNDDIVNNEICESITYIAQQKGFQIHPKHWAELDTMQIVMYFKLCKAVFEATKDSWENRGGDKIEAVGFDKVKESYPNYIDYEH